MTPLLWAGLAVAVPLAAWWLWQRHRARTLSTGERVRAIPAEKWQDQALDVIAEPDRRRAEHMNRTLRRVEGGDGQT